MKPKKNHAALDRRIWVHISQRKEALSDPDRAVHTPEWEEVNLIEYLRNAKKDRVYSKRINGNWLLFRPRDQQMSEEFAKAREILRLSKYEISHPLMRAVHEFYQDTTHDSAALNDLFLDITRDRLYGFIILNLHSADIDIKAPDTDKPVYFVIRYNENTQSTAELGWQTRCQYISRIFGDMGFESDIRGGYVHLAYNKPEADEELQDVVANAMRGLVSTTHLNIVFDRYPETLDKAVKAFRSGTTDIFSYLIQDINDLL